MLDRKDIAELAKRLHENGYTVDSLKAAVGRRFDDGGLTYSGVELNPSSVSATLSRSQWDKLYKEGKVELSDIPRKYQSWIAGNNSKLKHDVTKAMDDFGGKYVLPAVIGAAAGPSGAVGALANMVSDMAIQEATNGEKRTFGDLFFDPEAHPYLNLAANMLNPVNFIALDNSAPGLINRMPKNDAEALYQTLARGLPANLRRFYKWIPEKGKWTLHQYNLSDKTQTATDLVVGSVDIPKNISKKTADTFVRRLTSATNTPKPEADMIHAAKQLSDIQYNLKLAEKEGVLTEFIRKTISLGDGVPRYTDYSSSKQLYKLIGGDFNTVSFIRHGNNVSAFEFLIQDGKLATRHKLGTFSIPKNLKPEYYSTMLQGLRADLQETRDKPSAFTAWVDGLRRLDKEGTLNMFFDPQYEHVTTPDRMAYFNQATKMTQFSHSLDDAQFRRQVLSFGREVQGRDNQMAKSIFGDSYLSKILQESPQYTNRALELHNAGMNDEQIVKQLLDDRFTFARGVNMRSVETPELASESASLALAHIPETPFGGRSDIRVFGHLAPDEDALYTSNSLAAAFAYSYPEDATPGFVGVLKRRPETFDFSGSPLNWWHNNRLPDNVKIARSTMGNYIYKDVEDLSDLFESRFGKNEQASYILEDLIRSGKLPYNKPDRFNHFLMRGKKGEQPLDYMYLYKQIPTSGLSLEDIQKEMGVPVSADNVTRLHYGDMTPGFSQGNALGGKIERKFAGGGHTYTVQPGDTLSGISKRLTGKASNYMQLAAANKIEDADKILVGQKLVIPEKFDRPLKKSEIPTNNRLSVIDNYSPNYDYIVENDKIYYSRKGADHWVDISDNAVARANLYKFLGDKYKFRGYEDDEKRIGTRIENGTFDYHQYRDSINTEARTYNEKLQNSAKQEEAVPFTDSPYYLGDKRFSDLMPNIKSESTAKSEKSTSGQESENGQRVTQPLVNTEKSGIPFTEFPYYIGNADLPFWNKGSINQISEKKDAGDVGSRARNSAQDPSDDRNVLEKAVDGISTLASMGVNWASRQIGKISNDDERSAMRRPTYSGLDEDSEYGIVPGSFTGDTLSVRADARRYILPESLDMDDYTFGVRNRGDMSEIHSEAAPITAFRPFRKYGEHAKGYKTYIGIGADGRLKVGDISKFSDGDMLSGTYANKVYSFAKDKEENYIWQSDGKHGNRNQNVAAVIIEDEKTGEKRQAFPLNILANKNDKEGKTYGNITGGRVLVQVGNELRLLSGSIRDIEAEFEAMKKRQNVDYGMFYTLDNGSYNRGLRTFDKTFTAKDLRNYDEQNSGDSGNFMYIKSNYQKFPSDTVLTPNIRTEDSESYKKGHSDVNEQKGVVLHHTAFMEDSLDGVTNHFLDTNSEASSHVVIGFDGKRRVFATPDKVTFHAGSSYFGGRDNVNDFMIGIEFQGDTNKKPLTQEQIDSAVEYLAPIIRANGISLENITTHQNVRDLYNQYRKEYNLGKKAPSKPDITFEEYQRVIEALKQKVYYKKYDMGGPIDEVQKPPIDTVRLRQLVERINRTSNADFVNRLLDKNRKVLDNGDGSVSTHKLSYATDRDGNAVVFPEVQSDDADSSTGILGL